MTRKFNSFNNDNDNLQRLKIAKKQTKDNKFSSTYNSNTTSLSSKNEAHNHSGGYSCNGQTVVVKTNFEIAGRMKNDGSRATRASVGSHASASLDYMNGHGSEDIENDNDLSNIYDENGDRLSNQELKAFSKELEQGDNQAMRRIVISPGQDMSREEMVELVKNSMNDFMEQADKSFDYKFAIHTDTENIHAHVLATGDAKDINMTKTQLNMLKSSVSENTHDILHSREHSLDKEFNKELDKELENLKEQSKELDNDMLLDKAIEEVYGLDNQKDMSNSLSL